MISVSLRICFLSFLIFFACKVSFASETTETAISPTVGSTMGSVSTSWVVAVGGVVISIFLLIIGHFLGRLNSAKYESGQIHHHFTTLRCVKCRNDGRIPTGIPCGKDATKPGGKRR